MATVLHFTSQALNALLVSLKKYKRLWKCELLIEMQEAHRKDHSDAFEAPTWAQINYLIISGNTLRLQNAVGVVLH